MMQGRPDEVAERPAQQAYELMPSLPEHAPAGEYGETPMLAGGESYEWAAIPNLDIFFTRLYRYWSGKGLRAIILAGVLNLGSLAFTILFSAFLLLGVNWKAVLTADCIADDTCDIISVALYPNPLASRGVAADILVLIYMLIFGSYWAWSAVHFATDVRDMHEVRHFVSNKLGVSERSVGMMTWAELLHKVVLVQQTTRLCVARDLDEHDIVSRIMRKDNYLIALINKGVLQLTPPPLTQAAAAMSVMVVQGAAQATARGLAGAAGVLGGGCTADGTGVGGLSGRGGGARAAVQGGAYSHHEPDSEAGNASQPLLQHNHNGEHHDHGAEYGGVSSRQQRQQALGRRGALSQRLLQCSQALQAWAEGAQLAPGRAGCSNSSTQGCWGWLRSCFGRQGGEGWESGQGKAGGAGRPAGRAAAPAARKPLLTKTLEWNLRWFMLDHMFDDQFRLRREFVEQPEQLKKRLRAAAVLNAVLSPFLLVFLLLFFFLRNAERFYHHPGSAGSRRWSALARWRLREFNELPHYCAHRLDSAYAPACRYVSQFPNHSIASVARFVSFVAGSFTALLLLLTMLDERLLERPLLGRHLVWWLATLGVILTASRSFIDEDPVGYDPERAMQEVVAHTHYLPRHWRGRAHTSEVQAAFNQLFQYKVLIFLEELSSIVLTPFMLYFTLPACADEIAQFVADFTVHVEGIGDVCSFALFDLEAHGNTKYGAPELPAGPVPKAQRTKQGKLEKSLLTFVATYPTWEPGPAGRAMLVALSRNQQQYSHPGAAPGVLGGTGGVAPGFGMGYGMGVGGLAAGPSFGGCTVSSAGAGGGGNGSLAAVGEDTVMMSEPPPWGSAAAPHSPPFALATAAPGGQHHHHPATPVLLGSGPKLSGKDPAAATVQNPHLQHVADASPPPSLLHRQPHQPQHPADPYAMLLESQAGAPDWLLTPDANEGLQSSVAFGQEQGGVRRSPPPAPIDLQPPVSLVQRHGPLATSQASSSSSGLVVDMAGKQGSSPAAGIDVSTGSIGSWSIGAPVHQAPLVVQGVGQGAAGVQETARSRVGSDTHSVAAPDGVGSGGAPGCKATPALPPLNMGTPVGSASSFEQVAGPPCTLVTAGSTPLASAGDASGLLASGVMTASSASGLLVPVGGQDNYHQQQQQRHIPGQTQGQQSQHLLRQAGRQGRQHQHQQGGEEQGVVMVGGDGSMADLGLGPTEVPCSSSPPPGIDASEWHLQPQLIHPPDLHTSEPHHHPQHQWQGAGILAGGGSQHQHGQQVPAGAAAHTAAAAAGGALAWTQMQAPVSGGARRSSEGAREAGVPWAPLAASVHASLFGAPVLGGTDLSASIMFHELTPPAVAQPYTGMSHSVHRVSGSRQQQEPKTPDHLTPPPEHRTSGPGARRSSQPGAHSTAAAGGRPQASDHVEITVPGHTSHQHPMSASLLPSSSVMLLPANETDDLSRRLTAGHAILQAAYEQSDVTVQHRRLALAHHMRSSSSWLGPGGSSSLHWGGGSGSGSMLLGQHSQQAGFGSMSLHAQYHPQGLHSPSGVMSQGGHGIPAQGMAASMHSSGYSGAPRSWGHQHYSHPHHHPMSRQTQAQSVSRHGPRAAGMLHHLAPAQSGSAGGAHRDGAGHGDTLW